MEEERKVSKEVRFGNFLVRREKDGEYEYLRISAVSGVWSVTVRDDNYMFTFVWELTHDEKFRDFLESWIKMMYMLSMTIPDLDFMQDLYNAYQKLSERNAERYAKEPEDDAEVLEQVRTEMEMRKEFINQNEESHD